MGFSSTVPTKRKQAGSFTRALTASVLMLLLPATVLASLRIEFSLQFVIGCLITLYSGWKLTRLAMRRQQPFMQLTFWLFVYCWFGLAACAQMATSDFPWPAWKQNPGNLMVSEAIVILGCLAYEMAVSRPVRRVKSRSPLLFSSPVLLAIPF